MKVFAWIACLGVFMVTYRVSAQENAVWKNDRPFPADAEEKRAEFQARILELEGDYPLRTIPFEWKEMGPTRSTENWVMHEANYRRIRGTGRISFIEFDQRSRRIFVGSPTGGLFVRSKGGKSFANAGTDRLPNPGISHFQTDGGSNWFIATGDGDDDLSFSYGVFRSKDQGLSWQPINGQGDGQLAFTHLEKTWSPVTIRKMLLSDVDRDRLFIASTGGIFVSQNARASDPNDVRWVKLVEGEFYDIISRPFFRYEHLFAGGREIFFSTDGGETWNPLPGMEKTVLSKWKNMKRLRSTLRISENNPDLLYVAITGDDGKGSRRFNAHLYAYHIEEQTWEDLGPIPEENSSQRRMGAGRAQSFDVSPLDHRILIMGNVSRLWMSLDGGKSWEAAAKNFHDDLHWACFHPNGKEIWIGTDGGVNRSGDMGDSWEDHTDGIGVANMFNIAHSEMDHRLFMYGGYDTGNSLFRGQEPWIQVDFGDGFECHISDRFGQKYYYTSTHSGVSRFDSTGAVERITPSSRDIGSQWERQWVVHDRLGYMFYPGNKKLLRAPLQEKMNWEVFAETDNSFWEIFCLDTRPVLYATMFKKGGIYRTFNALEKQVESEILVPSLTEYKNGEAFTAWPSGLAINENAPNEFWVSYSAYGVGWEKYPKPKLLYYNGAYWEDWTGIFEGDLSLKNLSVTEVHHQKGTHERIYIGTNAGVFYKEGRTDSWKKLDGLPHAEVTDMEINYNTQELLVGTHGRGLWLCDLIPPDISFKVRSNEVWTDADITYDLVVKKGKELRLEGKTLMSKGVGIYVEPGARLVLDGAHLFNPNGMPWGGIDIGQSKGFLFFKGKKGKLEMINGARIE
jgi:hypothetical protein